MALLLHDELARTARRRPDAVALIAGDRRHSFAEIDRDASGARPHAPGPGVRRGDRVAVMADNSAEVVVAIYAALKAGGVFVVVNPTTKADKLAFILDDCQVTALGGPPPARPCGQAGPGRGGIGDHRRVGRRPARRARRRPRPGMGRRPRRRPGRAAGRPRRHRRRPGRPHLHVRIDRPAQGRDAHAPQPGAQRLVDLDLPRASARTTSSPACCRSRSTTACSRC